MADRQRDSFCFNFPSFVFLQYSVNYGTSPLLVRAVDLSVNHVWTIPP